MSDDRNVVLVTVDSLRADYCGFMGSDRGLTPNMDRHADDGLVFRNAISPGPSTLDALPGIFTGEDLVDDEGTTQERLEHHMRARQTIPERFAERGYETAAFTANPWTSRQFGFDVGFDHFEDFLEDGEGNEGAVEDGDVEAETADAGEDGTDGVLSHPLSLVRRWTSESNMFQAWGSFYDDVLAWTERAEEPYFLWLFLVDVHMPYLPVEGVRSQSRPATYVANLWLYLNGHDPGLLAPAFRRPLVRAYEDTIRYTDDLFDEFLADLAADDPAVVFHSDHGEAFGERGVFGHGPTLSEEQIHVPLFVANGPSGDVDRPFSLRRLPELLTALGEGGDAEDLASLTDPYAGARNRDPKFALRGADWKYVDDDGEGRLYDVDRGTRVSTDDAELATLADRLVQSWQRHESERERVTDATRAVVGATDV